MQADTAPACRTPIMAPCQHHLFKLSEIRRFRLPRKCGPKSPCRRRPYNCCVGNTPEADNGLTVEVIDKKKITIGGLSTTFTLERVGQAEWQTATHDLSGGDALLAEMSGDSDWKFHVLLADTLADMVNKNLVYWEGMFVVGRCLSTLMKGQLVSNAFGSYRWLVWAAVSRLNGPYASPFGVMPMRGYHDLKFGYTTRSEKLNHPMLQPVLCTHLTFREYYLALGTWLIKSSPTHKNRTLFRAFFNALMFYKKSGYPLVSTTLRKSHDMSQAEVSAEALAILKELDHLTRDTPYNNLAADWLD